VNHEEFGIDKKIQASYIYNPLMILISRRSSAVFFPTPFFGAATDPWQEKTAL